MYKNINDSIAALNNLFKNLIRDVPLFEVLNKDVLPYGLKRHTRSICWLAEQVILQNVKKRQLEYNISAYEDPDSDISAWDARLEINGISAPLFINIKVSDITKPVRRNDIASVQKLLSFYEGNPSALLFYVVIMLDFDDNVILFKGAPVVRHYPWIGDFVVNSRNHHIQSIYESPVIERTTDEFISIVKEKAHARRVL